MMMNGPHLGDGHPQSCPTCSSGGGVVSTPAPSCRGTTKKCADLSGPRSITAAHVPATASTRSPLTGSSLVRLRPEPD